MTSDRKRLARELLENTTKGPWSLDELDDMPDLLREALDEIDRLGREVSSLRRQFTSDQLADLYSTDDRDRS